MRPRCFGLATLVSLSLLWLALAQEKRPAGLPEGAKALRDLAYVPGGHERQHLDLYLPAEPDGPLPVIVWVHGGSWRTGSKDRCPALPLVGKGYAVASLNYRLSQHAAFPAQIADCKTAIRWLRSHAREYGLDPEHIGAWGASAGGHLVALLGTAGGLKELEGKGENLDQSSKVQAVCDWFGPTDFRGLGNSTNADNPVARLLGGPVSEKKELAALASPLAHVSKDAPPFLIMHGDQDQLVPLSASERLAEALKKAGVEVTLRTLADAGHGGAAFLSADTRNIVEEFFDRHLKKKPASK
jgi:acetyl esterase/lipase